MPIKAKTLDSLVAQGMKDFKIPGVALGIIKENKTIWAKGYGISALGSTEQVDNKTLFLVGSNTKAFTATLAAQLEEEGHISLDKPILEYMPEFKMYDNWVTKRINIRDMLSHKSGLGSFQGDFSQWNSTLSRTQLVEKLAKIKPMFTLRTQFGYCNYCYVAVGEALESVMGSSWDEQLKKRFFLPLEMNASFTETSEIIFKDNASKAHTLVDGKIQKIDYPNIKSVSAAGSMVSNLDDMLKWARVQLDSGRYMGKQIISKETILKTWTPETIISFSQPTILPVNAKFYGLGFLLADFNNEKYIYHGGGTDGFISELSLLPAKQLAIVVLTNSDQSGDFIQALKYTLLSAFTKPTKNNYYEHYFERFKTSQKNQTDRIAKEKKKITREVDFAFEEYTGEYHNAVYGDISISLNKGELTISFSAHPTFKTVLKPQGGHNFLAEHSYVHWGTHQARFNLDKKNKVFELTFGVNDFIEPYTYTFSKK